jgi:hypothetical protein
VIPLTLFLAWLFVIFFCAGSITIRMLQAFAGEAQAATTPESLHLDLPATLFLGIIATTAATSAISLLYSINLATHLTVSLCFLSLGGVSLWQQRSHISSGFRRLRRGLVLVGAIGTIAMIFVATEETSHYDTGLYHAQMVKWNTHFGVVPGLANLQGRFGFNSAWDVFAAFVDQGYFHGRSFHVVNLALGIMFLFACLQGWKRLFSGATSASTFLRCFGLLVLLYDFRHLLSSLSGDWPAAVFLYYATILTVEQIEAAGATHAARTDTWRIGVIGALCAFAMTIKLTCAPLFLLVPLSYATISNRRGVALLTLLMTCFVILPFVARNVVLTGYLVYPFSGLDIFHYDWKVPRTDVNTMRAIIKYWAINPVDDWYRARDMSLIEQLQVWLKWRGSESLFLLPWVCLGGCSWAWLSLRKDSRRAPKFVFYFLLCCILLLGAVFCVFNAPDARYVIGWCFAFALCPTAWLLETLTASCPPVARHCRQAGGLFLTACALWAVRHAGVKRLVRERKTLTWTLAPLPVVKMKEVSSEYGVVVKIPVDDDRAWDADLPTTTLAGFDPWLQMRGQTIAAGFRVTKPGFAIGRKILQTKAFH